MGLAWCKDGLQSRFLGGSSPPSSTAHYSGAMLFSGQAIESLVDDGGSQLLEGFVTRSHPRMKPGNRPGSPNCRWQDIG